MVGELWTKNTDRRKNIDFNSRSVVYWRVRDPLSSSCGMLVVQWPASCENTMSSPSGKAGNMSLNLPQENTNGKEVSTSTSPRRAVSPLLEVRRPHCTLNCDYCNAILGDRFRHVQNSSKYSFIYILYYMLCLLVLLYLKKSWKFEFPACTCVLQIAHVSIPLRNIFAPDKRKYSFLFKLFNFH